MLNISYYAVFFIFGAYLIKKSALLKESESVILSLNISI